MEYLIGLVVGFVVGGCVGWMTACLMLVSSRSEDQAKAIRERRAEKVWRSMGAMGDRRRRGG